MVRMDDLWPEKVWMARNAWEWLEMACTPRQIFLESEGQRKIIALRDFNVLFVRICYFSKTSLTKTNS